MSAIKRFFEKKKLNSKFKVAGSGQALNAPSSEKPKPGPSRSTERRPTTAAGAQAANAALSRFQVQQSQASKKPTSSATSWKHKTEVDVNSYKEDENPIFDDVKARTDMSKEQTIFGDSIIFCCPMCPVSLPYKEIFVHMKECFSNDLESEPLMISVTMIHTLNRDKLKVGSCIQILSKYLQNIIDNPGEEKYRKIRKTNKVFQEKVAILEGTVEFLLKGCGFELQTLPFELAGETSDHIFYVMNDTLAHDTEQLLATKQMLSDAEPLDISIDRNIRVYEPTMSSLKIEVPPSFYEVGTEELKQKQHEMTTEVAQSKQLRTKEMRKGDSKKRIYRYCIIRIRFPDGFLMQGTFSSTEKLKDLHKFVQECLFLDWMPFSIVDSIGKPFVDESATLMKLGLCPSSIVNLTLEPNIAKEIAAEAPNGKIQYLRDEYLDLIQNLP